MADSILMCPPTEFEVSYRINPWMDPSAGASAEQAVAEWEQLKRTYEQLGADVQLINPVRGLPDMVYAANGAFTVDGVALGVKFLHSQRTGEEQPYMDWLREHGFRVIEPVAVNEGEGDILVAGDVILAGWGKRTALQAHDELRDAFDHDVVSLRLVTDEFYHLDTALAVLPGTVAYLPEAFDDASRAELERRFPDAILASRADADVLGLNMTVLGEDVVLSDQLGALRTQIEERGLRTHPVGLPELLKGGGSIKCCTLHLRK